MKLWAFINGSPALSTAREKATAAEENPGHGQDGALGQLSLEEAKRQDMVGRSTSGKRLRPKPKQAGMRMLCE